MADLIRTAALAAYNAAVAAEKTAASDAIMNAIAAVLGTAVPRESLTIAFIDPVQLMTVITDGITSLAVVCPLRGAWEVYLVAKIDGKWTRQALVRTLVELGKALA